MNPSPEMVNPRAEGPQLAECKSVLQLTELSEDQLQRISIQQVEGLILIADILYHVQHREKTSSPQQVSDLPLHNPK